MVLYRITLVPLIKDLKESYSGLPSPFYADDAAFDRSTRRSAQLIKMLMLRGAKRGYLPQLSKLLFISDTPEK